MTSEPLSPAPTAASAPRRRGPRVRKWLVRGFWTLVCLAVGFILWALWYVNDHGFTRKWRRLVSRELEKQGIHTHIGKLTLNPLRGLVARDVKIVHARERNRMLATISEAVLDINYSNLVHGLPFVNAFDLRNARLSLPLDPADRDSERLEVTGLNARVLLPPNQLYVSQAEATVEGLRVSLKGRLINPEKFRPKPGAGRGAAGGIKPSRLLARIADLKLEGGAPSLEVRFDGDLANPSQLFAEAVFRSGPFSIRGEPAIRSARLIATFSEGTLRLRQCSVAGEKGELEAGATFHPATGDAAFHARSTLDLPALAARLKLWKPDEPLTFAAPPLLEVSGETAWRPPEEGGLHLKFQGHFDAGPFTAGTGRFGGASGDFSYDSARWFLRNGRLVHESGALEVTALNVPGEFRFAVESRIDPRALLPFVPARAAGAIEEWEFQAPPSIRLEGRAPSLSWQGLEAKGEIALGRTRFRGVGLTALRSPVEFREGKLRFPDFRIDRPEGVGTGTLMVDFNEKVVHLFNAKSTLTPVDVATWIDREGNLPRTLAPYRFRPRPPKLAIDGSVQLGGDEKTRLRIGVDAEGLDYVFVGKHLLFPKVDAVLWIERERLKIEDLRATLMGGTVKGEANISLVRGQGDYTASAQVENLDFPSLTQLYFGYDTSKGKLRGDYRFSGRGDAPRLIQGEGSLNVTDGNVFAIPIFGPFSGILNDVLPGTGYNQARKAGCTFTMKDGVIETNDLLVEGKGFSMMGGGKLFFLDDKMDFSIRINAQGAAGMLLSPVSHLFEYVSDGPLSKPSWRPKRLPKGIFAR